MSQSYPNHYETLQIGPEATPAELREAYRTQVSLATVAVRRSKSHPPSQILTVHPLKNSSDSEKMDAAKRFIAIEEAYKTLSDPHLKAEYDHSLILDHYALDPSQYPYPDLPLPPHDARNPNEDQYAYYPSDAQLEAYAPPLAFPPRGYRPRLNPLDGARLGGDPALEQYIYMAEMQQRQVLEEAYRNGWRPPPVLPFQQPFGRNSHHLLPQHYGNGLPPFVPKAMQILPRESEEPHAVAPAAPLPPVQRTPRPSALEPDQQVRLEDAEFRRRKKNRLLLLEMQQQQHAPYPPYDPSGPSYPSGHYPQQYYQEHAERPYLPSPPDSQGRYHPVDQTYLPQRALPLPRATGILGNERFVPRSRRFREKHNLRQVALHGHGEGIGESQYQFQQQQYPQHYQQQQGRYNVPYDPEFAQLGMRGREEEMMRWQPHSMMNRPMEPLFP